jgi:multidrug resistance efflux pump
MQPQTLLSRRRLQTVRGRHWKRALERYAAALPDLRTNRWRFEELFKSGAVSASQRDQAATESEVAEASLRAAEAQVKSDQEAVAAAESAIGLAILVVLFRSRRSINVQDLDVLKG